MAADKLLRIVITGDAKGALGAFAETEAGAGSLGGKLQGLGGMATAGFAVVAASAVGVGAALYDIGSKFDEAYDKIRVGTGATGADLDALKDSFRNVVQAVPTDFGKASDAITKLVQITGDDAGPGLDKLSEQFLEVSRITGTDLTTNLDAGAQALIGWGVPVDQQSAKLDELFRTTQLTGVSFSDLSGQLNSAGPVLRGLGVDFDSAAALAGTFGKNGLALSDVMPALSKTLATAAKEGKGAGDVFRDTFTAIQNSPSDVDAAGIALQVFGAKAGPKLAELIREGKLSYGDLLGQIQGGSDTILGAGQETQHFAEKWELFKNKVMVWLEPLATKVFDALGKAMDKLPSIAARIGDVFNDRVRPVFQWLADHFPLVAGAIAGVLVPAFALWATSAALAAAATVLAALPVIALVAGLAALGAGIVYAYQNFDGFRVAVDAVASFLRDTVWPIIQTVFGGIVTAGQAVVQFFVDHWSQISAAFEVVWTAIQVYWNAVVVPMFDLIVASVSFQIGLVTAVFDGIVSYWQTVWSAVQTTWDNVGSPVFGFVVGVAQTVVDYFNTTWSAIGTAFSAVWDAARAAWDQVGAPIFDAIKRVIDSVKSAIDGLISAWNTVTGFGHDNIPNAGRQVYNPATGKFESYGKNAMGTANWKGGLTWVGERGPELVSLPSGSAIHTAQQSRAMAAGSSIVIQGDLVLQGVQNVEQLRKELLKVGKRNDSIFGDVA